MNMKKLYRKIAKENGVTVGDVKRDMQAALDAAYINSPKDETTLIFQNKVPKKGEIPTIEEFISYVAKEVKNR